MTDTVNTDEIAAYVAEHVLGAPICESEADYQKLLSEAHYGPTIIRYGGWNEVHNGSRNWNPFESADDDLLVLRNAFSFSPERLSDFKDQLFAIQRHSWDYEKGNYTMAAYQVLQGEQSNDE